MYVFIIIINILTREFFSPIYSYNIYIIYICNIPMYRYTSRFVVINQLIK